MIPCVHIRLHFNKVFYFFFLKKKGFGDKVTQSMKGVKSMFLGCVMIALVVRGTDDFLSKIDQGFENPKDNSKRLKLYKSIDSHSIWY